MNLTACIMLVKCLKDILSSTTLNADGMHWEGVRQWSTGIHFFLCLTTSNTKRKLEGLSRVAKPLGLPLTSTEAEAKFAWGQKKKNIQTRLTFVSNLLVKTVQEIGGQTTTQLIVFFVSNRLETSKWVKNNVLWPLCLLSKSYKSHYKTFDNKHELVVAFFAFWAII